MNPKNDTVESNVIVPKMATKEPVLNRKDNITQRKNSQETLELTKTVKLELNKKDIQAQNKNTTIKTKSVPNRFLGILGLFACVGIACVFSSKRSAISWKLVAMGMGLQFVFALLILKTSIGETVFKGATVAISKLLEFSKVGGRILFGNLVDGQLPVSGGGDLSLVAQSGFAFAFAVLPTVLFFSALTALLFHFGIIQRIVNILAVVMKKTMGTTGAESLSAAANVFVGQTEAPLLIRPYLAKMSQSELMAVMTGGFATVAGGVMALYVMILEPVFPDIAGHLLAASVMSAPASLVMAKIFVPEIKDLNIQEGEAEKHLKATDLEQTIVDGEETEIKKAKNFLDAIAIGTSDGLQLALNVGAMLITFMALLALLNAGLGTIGDSLGYAGWSLESFFGLLLKPLAFLLGVPWEDSEAIASLMGIKTAANEIIAFEQLKVMMSSGVLHHQKSVVIATYALCGFSNFASIGIQIGGLSMMAPQRRAEFSALGLRAMLAASLACFQTAALAGILM